MVGADIDYVVVESDVTGTTERYVLGEARLPAYARELGRSPRSSQRLKGSEIAGRSYTPPFSYYAGHENAFRVVEAEFVTTTDGTGLVHTAGAFGEDDKVVTDREGIEPVMPVGKDGRFTFPVTEYEGMQVFDANLPIIDDLKAATRGEAAGSVSPGTVLLRRETYDHSYPHCWRCREPLIYKGVSSWFVEVTAVKQRLLELNEEIRWVPDHIKHGQFGKWLGNARDWSITRNRFWGSPVPVWKSDDPTYPRLDVYGSFEQLEADFGVPVDRPAPAVRRRAGPPEPGRPDREESMMRRVPDVLDVWFDSGSMSFAQVHYPFENADWFEHHFPGDFITEYIGQTRGWFYTMHILAGAIFDRPAFKTSLSHGIVLGSDGQKMSKSLRNYPDVREVFDRDGADAMRWFLMSSPILRGGNLVVTEQGIRDSVRQVMIPLWNSWYFFGLYANASGSGAGYDAQWSTASTDPLDRYLLAKCRQYVEAMTHQLDNYEVAAACDSTRSFLDVLTNWYIRRSRDRFWGDDTRGLRHAAHRARRGLPGHRAAAAADHRGDLARPDRWPLGAPGRLAVGRRPARGRRAGRRDGRRTRRLLVDLGAAQGRRPAQPAAAGLAHRGRRRRRRAGRLRGHRRRRAQRQGGAAARPRCPRGRVVRRVPEADGQRPRRGPPARQGRPARDQGLEVRRLVGGRGRHRHRRWAGAGRGGVHPRDGRRRHRAATPPPRCCRAAASWCWTPR